jgi:catechol 2,3-dioxygenase-like lactoylglutathione lyase family enzyme
VRIDAIVFDCIDAAPLARFWAKALGWEVAPYDEAELDRLAAKGVYDPEDDPSVMVRPPEDSDFPLLFFTEVPERRAGKNRVHVDIAGEMALEDEVDRLSDLGATVLNWAEEDGSIWCVMQDPEGNEFCVMSPD